MHTRCIVGIVERYTPGAMYIDYKIETHVRGIDWQGSEEIISTDKKKKNVPNVYRVRIKFNLLRKSQFGNVRGEPSLSRPRQPGKRRSVAGPSRCYQLNLATRSSYLPDWGVRVVRSRREVSSLIIIVIIIIVAHCYITCTKFESITLLLLLLLLCMKIMWIFTCTMGGKWKKNKK